MARRFGRGRRRPRVVWLPVLGQTLATGTEPWLQSVGGTDFKLIVPTNGNISWESTPVTFDYTEDASDNQDPIQGALSKTLQDLVSGNEYRLRRIVGKCHAYAYTESQELSAWPHVEFAAGFIVVRTDDEGTPTTDFDFVNPLQQDSMEDPWIWRRKWVLSLGNYTDTTVQNYVYQSTAFNGFPRSTAFYGSVADGPHIDQKTARVIHRSERLWFVKAARIFNPMGIADIEASYAAPVVAGICDTRLLASMRATSSGNRGNASR